jgi:hypothetical protein
LEAGNPPWTFQKNLNYVNFSGIWRQKPKLLPGWYGSCSILGQHPPVSPSALDANRRQTKGIVGGDNLRPWSSHAGIAAD